MSGIELPYRAIRSNIAEALNLIVHVERRAGHRHVSQVCAVRGYDAARDRYHLNRIYDRA
jgi:Flp pilus assembly CpaF family ATPase